MKSVYEYGFRYATKLYEKNVLSEQIEQINK